MSYADGLLSSGERILYRTKQHPFIFVWGARYAILAVVIVLGLAWLNVSVRPDGAISTLLNVATIILFFGGLAVFAWTAIRYINQEYVLTNRRVIQVEGVLNRTATDSSLEKINDAVLTQSIFGRLFGFGDLAVLTAAESGIERMHMLRDPIAFKKAMLDAKHEAEVDMERAGWAPAPPIRDGAAAGGPGGSAPSGAAPARPASDSPTGSVASVSGSAPAAASAAPARADPDEVTRTLASLADLRDRGAITAEEYDRKKADLLSRL
jgi:uncharacterized small protein (DUF1192 family)